MPSIRRGAKLRALETVRPILIVPIFLVSTAAVLVLFNLEKLKRLFPTDAGASTAWATWILVVVTILVLLGSLVAVWWQVRCQRRIESAKMVLALRDRFDSTEMQRQRKRLSELLLSGNQITHRDDAVLVLFDTVGLLVRRRILDLEMVWYEFCWDVVRYWGAFHHPVNQIRALREAAKDETLYQELEWLALRLLRLDARRRGLSQDVAKANAAEVQEFLNDEKSL